MAKESEKLRFLILRDVTGESWTVRIPLSLFKFLTISLVALVILAGVTITWLGAIAIRLQAAEMMAEENRTLRAQLKEVEQLREQLRQIEDREKALNSLTQAFLDDPDSTSKPVAEKGNSVTFGDESRAKFLQEVLRHWGETTQKRIEQGLPRKIPYLASPIAGENAFTLPSDSTDQEFDRLVYCSPGSLIRSPTLAIVAESQWTAENGLRIRLELPDGFELTFSDLGESPLQPGDIVQQGEVVGKTRLHGSESSSQFHMKLALRELAIDPWFAMMR